MALKYLKHYLRIITKIIATDYPYKKTTLFLNYVWLIFKSIIYHKIISQRKSKSLSIKHENFLGYEIEFLSYPQLINLIEEIFIFQVYKFSINRADPVIIDCGSNIGLAILYFKKLYPASKILAFEPDKEAFAVLNQNVFKNNLRDVSVFNFALQDKDGENIMYKDTLTGSLNMSLIKSSNTQQQVNVDTRKLSNYIDTKIDILKIDVEGSEIKIINDIIVNKKIKHIDKIIMEYHPHLTKITIQEIKEKIIACNFSCHSIEDKLHEGASEVMIHCRNNL